jgi:protein gp37
MAEQRDDGIAYLDATWNPLAMRCDRVLAGCANCWHLPLANRMAHNPVISAAARAAYAGGAPYLDERKLTLPLHWKKPRRMGVQFVSDLFHENVPDEWIDRVFAVMALADWHTYLILTKRPERMAEYFTSNSDARIDTITMAIHELRASDPERYDRAVSEWMNRGFCDGKGPLPLPNVLLGTSVENQQAADERIPHLLATPAAVRFLSMEPLLGAVNLHVASDFSGSGHGPSWMLPIPSGAGGMTKTINWVVVGGESGPKARPCELQWIRNIVKQCQDASVPVFVKQLGARPSGTPCVKSEPLGDGLVRTMRELAEVEAIRHSKGADMTEWPEDLRVQQFPPARCLKRQR